jgi:type VI secretion system protein ImpF
VAEILQRERLKPSLLDRLTDLAPDVKADPTSGHMQSMRELKDAVLRDLEWLFNAGNLASTVDLSGYPQVVSSVLNYGIPDLAGRAATGIKALDLERLLLQAIRDFEPRLLRQGLKLKVVRDAEGPGHIVRFEIDGELWAQPTPQPIRVLTEIDVESNRARVRSLDRPNSPTG